VNEIARALAGDDRGDRRAGAEVAAAHRAAAGIASESLFDAKWNRRKAAARCASRVLM
jgi:hypothetical protein